MTLQQQQQQQQQQLGSGDSNPGGAGDHHDVTETTSAPVASSTSLQYGPDGTDHSFAGQLTTAPSVSSAADNPASAMLPALATPLSETNASTHPYTTHPVPSNEQPSAVGALYRWLQSRDWDSQSARAADTPLPPDGAPSEYDFCMLDDSGVALTANGEVCLPTSISINYSRSGGGESNSGIGSFVSMNGGGGGGSGSISSSHDVVPTSISSFPSTSTTVRCIAQAWDQPHVGDGGANHTISNSTTHPTNYISSDGGGGGGVWSVAVVVEFSPLLMDALPDPALQSSSNSSSAVSGSGTSNSSVGDRGREDGIGGVSGAPASTTGSPASNIPSSASIPLCGGMHMRAHCRAIAEALLQRLPGLAAANCPHMITHTRT